MDDDLEQTLIYLACSRCHETKDQYHFYRANRFARQYTYWCVDCLRTYKKEDRNRQTDRTRKARRRAQLVDTIRKEARHATVATADV